MSTPSNPLTVTPELRTAIQGALDPENIKAAVRTELEKQAAESQRLAAEQAAAEKAAADKVAADKAAADAAAAAAGTTFTRTETIGGREFTFEAGSETELNEMILNAYRIASGLTPDSSAAPVEEVVDEAAEVQRAAALAAARAELELKFKRGEITTQEYLEQSGAVADYLEKQGLSLDTLRATVEATESKTFEQSWADATEIFLNSVAGADWPGGEQNRELIGMKLAQMGLVEASDKVAALAQAWNDMKSTKMYFAVEPPTAAAADALATATKAAADKAAADAAAVAALAAKTAAAPAAAAPAAAPTKPATSSSLFGASSGTASENGAGSAERQVSKQVEIPKDASPAEIIAAWKEAQLALGKDPNAAFMETFQARRA